MREVRYSDDVGATFEFRSLNKIWTQLKGYGIDAIPNLPDGRAVPEELAERMGIPELSDLVANRQKERVRISKIGPVQP